MKLELNITPEAKELTKRLARSVEHYESIVDSAMKAVAEKAAETVRQTVLDQNFHVVPLTAAWAARKRAKGLDPRVLIATKEYVDSIKATSRGRMQWGVEAIQPKADVLEKKRPHREPVVEAFDKTAVHIFSEEIIKLFKGGT